MIGWNLSRTRQRFFKSHSPYHTPSGESADELRVGERRILEHLDLLLLGRAKQAGLALGSD